MTFAQRSDIMKTVIKSQFGFCPLVWMFCEIHTNPRINHMHEGALGAVYNDEMIPFEQLFTKRSTGTTHPINIKILAAELFKINLSNDIMAQLICKRNRASYNLRSQANLSLPQMKLGYNRCDIKS